MRAEIINNDGFDQQRYLGLNVERYFLGHELLKLAKQQLYCSNNTAAVLGMNRMCSKMVPNTDLSTAAVGCQ